MATYRPAVEQSIADAKNITVAVPFKDGNNSGYGPVTQAQYGAYTPADWAYRPFSDDPRSGVFVTFYSEPQNS
jgi:hypothetical protein